MRISILVVCVILVVSTGRAAAPSTETFEQAGSDPASSLFSTFLIAGDGLFVREPLDASSAAPESEPALPVDQGGDKELRYSEVTLAGTSSFALTPDAPGGVFSDMQVDAFLAFGLNEVFGAPSGGLVLRAAGETRQTFDAYAASIRVVRFDPQAVVLSILRYEDGVAQVLIDSDEIPIDADEENLHLTFRAEGTTLEAKLGRASVVGAEIVEAPVDLDASTMGVQDTLTVSDASLEEGRIGLTAFVRADNHVLFDDVSLADEIFVDSFESGDLTLWSAATP